MASDFSSNKTRFFNQWALTYDWLIPSLFYQTLHRRLLDYVELPAKASVLDIGCGTGRLLNRLAEHFPQMMGTGLDLSPGMLRQARSKNRHHPRLIFVQGSSEAMPFATGQFEAAFCTISFLHYPNPERVMVEVQRVLQLHGRFYLVDYTVSDRTPTGKAMPISPGGIWFYSRLAREQMGHEAGLRCLAHYRILGPVVLTVFEQEEGGGCD